MANEQIKKDDVSNESSKQQPKTTVSFYGKKLYSLNPAIGRRKVLQAKQPSYEDVAYDAEVKELRKQGKK